MSASITVDLPEPVGPTSAKYSAPVKSTTAGSRKAAKPCISSRTGRIRPSPSPRAARGCDPVVQPGEQLLDPPVVDRPGAEVLVEQLAGAAVGAGGAGRSRPRDRRRELRVDPHLQGVRQQLRDLLAQPRAGLLAHPDPQQVVADRRRAARPARPPCRAPSAAAGPR